MFFRISFFSMVASLLWVKREEGRCLVAAPVVEIAGSAAKTFRGRGGGVGRVCSLRSNSSF